MWKISLGKEKFFFYLYQVKHLSFERETIVMKLIIVNTMHTYMETTFFILKEK